MEKNIAIWIVMVGLFIVALFLVFQAGFGSTSTIEGEIDTTGWSVNEIMNYEMHGTIPSRVRGGASPVNNQMVGGC
ncbi:MAG: hypothetical protein NUV46_04090 [Nanoarchaeota archaeon]|nr:hypothetical protein [Nanoarchaeota archaeon]